jgi:hypothetical protein
MFLDGVPRSSLIIATTGARARSDQLREQAFAVDVGCGLPSRRRSRCRETSVDLRRPL